MLSNIMKPTQSVLKLLIHILELMEHANLHLVLMTLSELPTIKIVQESLLLPQPSKEDQYPSELMLHNGHLIPEVSSPTVEHPSITEFYSLDIPQAIG
jgi:hypothetical protein